MRRLRTGLILIALVAGACSNESDTVPTTVSPATTAAGATPSTVGAPAASTSSTSVATTTTSTTAPPPPEPEFLWEDVTEVALPRDTSGTWSNKVELADIDGDGDVDLLFADGGDYTGPGAPAVNQAWLNDGGAVFTDASEDVFGTEGDSTRVLKARDVNGDGIVDLIAGNTFQTQSRLYLGTGGGAFEEATATNLPSVDLSVGDLELGDVDGDGDLDMVLAHWGDGHPALSGGGLTQLWLNDGNGAFTDVTADQMPAVPVEWSWELELVDIDNDFDLDIAVSCKGCDGGFLFENDGSGRFGDATAGMPQFGNNYEYESIDLDGDGFLDLVTLNDGDLFSNHVFFSDGAGGFIDVTEAANPDGLGTDDNMAVFLDFDSDGDADVLIGNLGPRDRLMVNDGAGNFTVLMDILGGTGTGGALGTAVADLDGDGRLDVVQSQGEVGDMSEHVFLGGLILPDTAQPIVGEPVVLAGAVHVRIHDNKSPLMPHDFTSVALVGPEGSLPMAWYGEYLWRAIPPSAGEYQVCAIDAAGNEACSSPIDVG